MPSKSHDPPDATRGPKSYSLSSAPPGSLNNPEPFYSREDYSFHLAEPSPLSETAYIRSIDEPLSSHLPLHSRHSSLAGQEARGFRKLHGGSSFLPQTRYLKRHRKSVGSIATESQMSAFQDVQNALSSFVLMSKVTNDIHRDLYQWLNNQDPAMLASSNGMRLTYRSGARTDYATSATIFDFLNSIPLPVLDQLLEASKKYVDGLEAWRDFRTLALEWGVSPEKTHHFQTQSKGEHVRIPSSSTIPHVTNRESFKPQKAPVSTHSRKKSLVGSISGLPSRTERGLRRAAFRTKSSESLGPFQPNETITLRVNPSKLSNPELQMHQIQPPLRKAQGQLHPELSAKQEPVCMQCGRKDTPEWRKGPDGARTLCNACGLFHSKLFKKMGLEEANLYLLKLREQGIRDFRKLPKDL